jgi:ubiquitin carboxyl-terminal hydrolase 22/27/51
VPAPVGMYNLGNTCFMSAIFHCLIHCVPLQRYFLRDIGHNHAACAIYRKSAANLNGVGASRNSTPKLESVCLACEMDKLFLRYIGSALGLDVLSAANSDSPRPANDAENESTGRATKDGALVKGDPLIVADMLTAAWKCGGMNHLAGYEQRDAHEFLHGFLEILGKHMRQYRTRMYAAINIARPANSYVNIDDEKIQHGTFPVYPKSLYQLVTR